MAYLFDTVVVSAARRPEKQNSDFVACLSSFDSGKTFLSAITIMELRFGVQLQQAKNPAFANELQRWIDEDILIDYADRILPFDSAVALRTGTLPTPHKRPSPDAMIAATALHHRLIVVTRNIADFEPLGVRCLDPWTFRP